MASRDIKMVISATDKASQATDAVREALVALREAQMGAMDSADQTSNSLTAFGSTLGTLQQTLRGNNVGEQLETQFEKARAATRRLEEGLEEATRSQVEYARRSKESASAVEVERRSVIALEAALSKERATRNALRTELNRANRPIARAEASGGTATPEQLAAAERAEQAFKRQAAAVQALENNLATARGRVRDLVAEEKRLATAADNAGDRIVDQNQKLVSARAALLKMGVEAGRAEDALQELGRSAAVELQRAVAAQRQLTGTAGVDFNSAQAGVGPAEQEFLQAQRAADEYQVTLGESAQKTRELRAESDRLEKAFQDQRGLAEALRQEYIEQQQTLARLGMISRETATDVNEIAARQARFTAEQERGQRAVERIRQSINRYQSSINRASERTARLAAEQTRLQAAAVRAGTGTRTLSAALRQFFGEGKRALSITQRLRGQVLSLATQYVGFFAVFQGVGAVVNSVQQLEGATNSLAAVFDGDFDAVNGELDFLRRNADRLGIGFGQLSEDYTKFAAATKNTPIQDETRAIFIRVAEAGRVLNLTADQMSGTLTALSQIASKGVVSMEELRQQLGDRLPGALQIMADGLNISTAELIKLIETGELSSTALVGFAGELEKRFGPQLAGSLTSLNAELGRFANALFESQIAFANGGFLESFVSLIRTATETLKSADFQSFLGSIGQGFSLAFGLAEAAIRNFQLVFTGLVAFMSVKFLPVIIGTIASVGAFGVQILRAGRLALGAAAGIRAGAVSMGQMAAGARSAAVSVGLLANTTKGALASTGIGLTVVAITTVMAALSTQADETAEALERQKGIVDALKNTYDTGADSIEDYAEALSQLTAAEARQNLRALQQEAASLEAQLDNILTLRGESGQGSGFGQFFDGVEGVDIGNLFGGNRFGSQFTREFAEEIKALAVAFDGGAISAREFELATQRAAEAQNFSDAENSKFIRTIELVEENIEVRQQLGTAVQLNAVKVKELRGELELADIATIAAANSTDELGASLRDAAPDLVSLSDTLREISKGVPKLAAELKKTEELEALGETLEAAGLSADIEMLTAQVEQFARLSALTANIPFIGPATAQRAEELQAILDATLARIAEINKPRQTREARDPFKEARERLEEAIAGDELKLELDQLRSQGDELSAILLERASFVDGILSELSVDQQRTLAEELGTTYEELGNRIFEATRAEKAKEGLEAIVEAVSEAQIALDEATRGDDTSADRTTNFAGQLARDIQEMQQEVNQLDLTPLEAQQAQEGIERVRALRIATFNLGEAERQLADARTAAQQGLAVLADLEERRKLLVQQLGVAIQQNNQADVSQLQGRINELDEVIVKARDDARDLLMNVVDLGGDEAITALERLNAGFEKTQQTVAGTQVTVMQVANIIADNLTDAVSQFAEAVANGENPIKALGRALRQFASDTLIEIGRVIARALIMQAVLGALGLGGIGGGTGGGNLIRGIVAHEGKKGGKSSNRSRSVDASVFAGAPKFHQGRTGLSTGEMAAIIKTDEDVLTRDNPFHSANLGNTVAGIRGQGAGGGAMDVKIVNVIEPADILEAALADTPGQRVVLNYIRRDAEDINATLDR